MTSGDDLAAAEATIIALRAGLPPIDAAATNEMILNGEHASKKDVVRRLAMMRKPVRCSAALRAGRTALGCQSLAPGAERDGFLRVVSEAIAANSAHFRARTSLAGSVLIMGIGEQQLLSAVQFEHWMRSYLLDGVLATLDDASPEFAALGARVVVTFRPVDGNEMIVEFGE